MQSTRSKVTRKNEVFPKTSWGKSKPFGLTCEKAVSCTTLGRTWRSHDVEGDVFIFIVNNNYIHCLYNNYWGGYIH